MEDRFEIISEQDINNWNDLLVIKDKKTSVLYLCSGRHGGLTVLVDKDGKPLTDSYKITI